MKLLAIDPGTNKTGLAFFINGTLTRLETLEVNALTPLHRRLAMALSLKNAIGMAERVICEEPFLQGKANTGMQRLLGMIEFLAGQTIQMIHPMTVKKTISPGHAEKIDVALAAGSLMQSTKEKELIAQALAKEAFDETDAAAVGLAWMKINKEKKIYAF